VTVEGVLGFSGAGVLHRRVSLPFGREAMLLDGGRRELVDEFTGGEGGRIGE